MVAVPLMAIIMLMARRPDVVGRFALPRAPWAWAMAWLCTGTMVAVVTIMFATWRENLLAVGVAQSWVTG